MSYFFSQFQANVQPFLFRGANRSAAPGQILLRLPNLFLQAQTASIRQGPFEVTARPGDAAFPYQMAIPAASSLWQFDASRIRASPKSEFLKLLAALESRGLRPGALALVQQVIANGLPWTFSETVLYRHGLDPERRSVDLQPGMRLRLEPQVRQFVGPDSREQILNGYVGAGEVTAEVGLAFDAANARVTGFNAFLSALRPQIESSTGGGGGVVDLYARGLARTYARLLYPPSFGASDGAGFAGPEKNVAILGADTWADLEAATALYLGQGTFDGIRNAAVASFRGRTAVTPEISVLINGEPVWVALGTSFRQLVSRFTVLPPAEAPLDRIAFRRSLGNLADDAPRLGFYRSDPVDFDQRHLGVYSNGTDCFDLPLLAGDSLRLPADVG